ncbi:hypothetical protein M3Y94_00433900 [Aphelenchoides besseyi]|nr:hypothetical protein M3Y94_00433900 [Aphelenchoides besseyi]KAI6229457.1 hypothetical protein M3Y95_00533000 [Aphelenchoides besseyi]
MFASGHNETDSECFQHCNDEWKKEFEQTFNLKENFFYDFPFHPILLEPNGYRQYCELSKKQTSCFVERCNDETADRVFSPSNFLCNFKRAMFLTARSCLQETEPLNFLKCDRECHAKAMETKKPKQSNLGKVFSTNELQTYENELEVLCKFQECYKQCHALIVEETCSSALANVTIELVESYVQWHASDIYDWHLLSGRMDMPESCFRLTGYKRDPIVEIMSKIS